MALTFRTMERMLDDMSHLAPMWPAEWLAAATPRQSDSLIAMSPLNANSAQCNLIERPDHFEVTANIPGFTKEEVNVEVHHGVLRIAAEHKEETKDEGERDGWKYHRVERRSGSLHRQIKLPPSADLDNVAARAENGVLTINIAKKAEALKDGPRPVTVA